MNAGFCSRSVCDDRSYFRRSLILHGLHGVFLFGVLCVVNDGGSSWRLMELV